MLRTELQETYEVCDGIAYNKETSTSDFWTYWSSTSNSANTVSVDNTGTTISTNSTMYTATYMQIWLKDLAGYKDIPLCIELDVIESSNFNLTFHCKQSDGTTDWNQTPLTTGHWKINVTNNKLEVYKDNILKWSKSLNNTQTSTFLQSSRSSGNGMIKFKNYVVYPV